MDFQQLLAENATWQLTALRIFLYFFGAWIFHILIRKIAPRIVRLSRFSRNVRKPTPERQTTLGGLVAGVMAAGAYLTAGLFSMRIFVDTDTLVWMIGLFSAAFGLSARPIISDLLSGVGFLFEDAFSVGEKVELVLVEGVIEKVFLRTTHVRGINGELYIIPNGEIRIIRNFSRGRFSVSNISFKVDADKLGDAIALLEGLSEEAVSILPNLLEPWQIINESGSLGQHTELTIVAKARFGQAADMRPRLLAFIQERLAEAEIQVVD